MQIAQASESARPLTREEVALLERGFGAVDAKARQLDLLTQQLATMIAKGGVPRAYLEAHNAAALVLYAAQREALEALGEMGVAVPAVPPFPALFLSRSGNEGGGYLDLGSARVLRQEDVVLYLQSPRAPAVPAPGELAGVFLLLAVLGLVGIGGFTTYKIVDVVARERTKRLAARLVNDMFRLLIEQIRWRTLKVMESADKCRKEDPKRSYADCVAVALGIVEATPAPPYKEIMKVLEAGAGRSWLWWIGLGVVILAGGGITYAIVRRRREGRLRRRDRPSPKEIPAGI